MKRRTYLLILLMLAPMCFAQELNIKRFKSAIRQEQAKIPITMSLDSKSNQYVSTGGIYKSIAKPITEKMPFGFEFDGKHMSFEPLDITWDTGETAVVPSKDLSTMAKVDDKVTYSKSSGITYSIETQNEKWRKLVTIDTSVLSIPKGAKHLVLSFLVDTDFNLPKGQINTRHELVDDCWLETAKVWIDDSTEYTTIKQEFSSGVFKKYIPIDCIKGTIQTDANVTFGSLYIAYDGGYGYYHNLAVVDATKFIGVFTDSVGIRLIGGEIIDETTISTQVVDDTTFGSPYIYDVQIHTVDENKVLITGRKADNYVNTAIMTLNSDLSLSFSARVTSPTITTPAASCILSPTRFAVFGRRPYENKPFLYTGGISGDTITNAVLSSTIGDSTTSFYYPRAVSLNYNRVVGVYSDYHNDYVVSFSVDEVLNATAEDIESYYSFNAPLGYRTIQRLDDTTFLLAWRTSNPDAYPSRMRTRIGTVDSNGQITLGETQLFENLITYEPSITMYDDEYGVITTLGLYPNTAPSNRGFLFFPFKWSEGLITLGSHSIYTLDGAYSYSLAPLRFFTENNFIAMFCNNDTDKYASLILGESPDFESYFSVSNLFMGVAF